MPIFRWAVTRLKTCHRAGGVIPIAGVLFLALATIDVNVGVWAIKNRLTGCAVAVFIPAYDKVFSPSRGIMLLNRGGVKRYLRKNATARAVIAVPDNHNAEG